MLKVGDNAPLFEAKNQNEKHISLNTFKGGKVILYFYPKDDTPGCTKEACSFRDSFSEFIAHHITILGVSRDSPAKHKKFIEKYSLPFDLISDETGEITEKYGVWVEKSLYGKTYMGIERATFLIDEKGVIRFIWPKVSVTNHISQILSLIESS